MVSGDRVDVDIHGVRKTGKTREHIGKTYDILEVSLMIQVSDNGASEFKGEVGPDSVELKSDPGNFHPDELKDLMAGAAHRWDKEFGDWDCDILMRPEPV